jgi:hypothetical protein
MHVAHVFLAVFLPSAFLVFFLLLCFFGGSLISQVPERTSRSTRHAAADKLELHENA